MMTIEDIASELSDHVANIQLLYAFNSVGKTRLSVAYKNATKDEDGTHTGIYYNAYSEDLFVWNNDIENGEADIRLTVLPSSLNSLHADLNEPVIHEQLKPYRPSFDFRFTMHTDAEKGIESISFFPADTQPGDVPPIKISRGEERVFVWCTAFSLSNIDHTKFFDTMQWFFLFRDINMLHRLQLTVPVIKNNIYIIRMFLKCSIPGNIQNQGFSRDFVIYSAHKSWYS